MANAPEVIKRWKNDFGDRPPLIDHDAEFEDLARDLIASGSETSQMLASLVSEDRGERGFRNPQPVIASNNVKYELSERAQAIGHGGLTALFKLAPDVGLVDNNKNTYIF